MSGDRTITEHTIRVSGRTYAFTITTDPRSSQVHVSAPGVVGFWATDLDNARDLLRSVYSEAAG